MDKKTTEGRKSEEAIEMGKKVRHLRRMKDMTQQQVADLAGLSRNAVVNVEAGRYNTSIEKVCKIVHALGYDMVFIKI